jgi:drug/metabolite transporter (DMT)-like permease
VEASLLLTVFFFGTNFVAVKLVVADVPPVLFAAARFTLAGTLLFVISRFAEPGTRLKRGDLLPVLGLGVVGITLTQTVFTVGVGLTTAANTALVYSTSPVWGMLLGFALGLERPRLAGVLGICLSLVGVGFIVYGGLEFAGTSLVGDALILAAAVFWGSYTVLSWACWSATRRSRSPPTP